MITLYHAPNSRSSAIVTLLDQLDVLDKVEIKIVNIRRFNGEGARDPHNPHPDGKVPYLVNGDDFVHERAAICVYLTDMFPQNKLGPLPGEPKRGQYLSWLSYYQGVVEPLLHFVIFKIEHPALTDAFRSMTEFTERLEGALAKGPFLLGEHYSAADLLMHSPFVWMPDATPDVPAIKEWVKRCSEGPYAERLKAIEAKLMSQ